jgi:hypothetical protein
MPAASPSDPGSQAQEDLIAGQENQLSDYQVRSEHMQKEVNLFSSEGWQIAPSDPDTAGQPSENEQ